MRKEKLNRAAGSGASRGEGERDAPNISYCCWSRFSLSSTVKPRWGDVPSFNVSSSLLVRLCARHRRWSSLEELPPPVSSSLWRCFTPGNHREATGGSRPAPPLAAHPVSAGFPAMDGAALRRSRHPSPHLFGGAVPLGITMKPLAGHVRCLHSPLTRFPLVSTRWEDDGTVDFDHEGGKFTKNRVLGLSQI